MSEQYFEVTYPIKPHTERNFDHTNFSNKNHPGGGLYIFWLVHKPGRVKISGAFSTVNIARR